MHMHMHNCTTMLMHVHVHVHVHVHIRLLYRVSIQATRAEARRVTDSAHVKGAERTHNRVAESIRSSHPVL